MDDRINAVKDRSRKLIFWSITFLALLQLPLIVAWFYLWRAEDQKIPTTVDMTTIQTLANHLFKSNGNMLVIDYDERNPGYPTLTYDLINPLFPRNVNSSKPKKNQWRDLKPIAGDDEQRISKAKKYVYHSGPYWEQLSMNTRVFLGLVLQATIGGRRVVKPRAKDSRFGIKGNPLDKYFNMTHLENILEANSYSTLIDQKQYDAECSLNDSSYTTVHFLYDQEKAATFTKKTFYLSDKQYNNIQKEARTTGWIRCPFIANLTKQSSSSKMFCVDPTIITDWNIFERDIIHRAKCLHIILWRGVGSSYRARFREDAFRVTSNDIQSALNPSLNIINEARRFQKVFLPSGRYLAIHVRGEQVALTHGVERLKKCIGLLIEVINLMKELTQIDQVFISTDMSSYGSGSWNDSLKNVPSYAEKPHLRNAIISSINGILYKPSTDQGNVDRGVVALIQMRLLAQANNLVTIGGGSFHNWIVNSFLNHHRYSFPRHWSIVTLCAN